MSQPKTFEEFWYFYLGEHRNAVNRWLHVLGSSLGLVWLGLAIWLYNPWLVPAALLNGYAFAWIGHFFVEKNKPATFTYPLWSFVCDWVMWFKVLTGQIGSELAALEARAARAEDEQAVGA